MDDKQLLVLGIAIITLSLAVFLHLLLRVIRWLNTVLHKKCKHRFALEDLHKTGDDEDSDTRVEWACADCGKVFKAHCGLDISPKHGFMFRRGQS